MKTYEEILDEVVTDEYKRINPVAINIHRNAAKEYAKQWIDEAAEIAMMQTEKGLPVGDAIYALKNQINAQ